VVVGLAAQKTNRERCSREGEREERTRVILGQFDGLYIIELLCAVVPFIARLLAASTSHSSPFPITKLELNSFN